MEYQRLSLVPPLEPWGLVGQTGKGSRRHPGSETAGFPLAPLRRLHFLNQMINQLIDFFLFFFFLVVIVRKNFYGTMGFFYGKHLGAELTMENPEFTSGSHRRRWEYWLHDQLPRYSHSKTCERGKWKTAPAKTWLETPFGQPVRVTWSFEKLGVESSNGREWQS